MSKIDIISGFLGAGKTTLIKKLIAEAYQNEKIVLIENEFGEIGIDGTFLKDSKKYTTKKADEYGHTGGGKVLVDNFTKAFGESFDNNIHHVTDYINGGTITLADIKMNIIPTGDAFDIEIPEINSIYTHMLGSDCHSIIAGVDYANAMIDILKGYIEKNYNLILTSHYIPEDSKDEMIEKVKEEYPNYSGVNYLEMTAGFFFGE